MPVWAGFGAFGLPLPYPAPAPLPQRSQKPSRDKLQIKAMNFEFRKRPLDLLCSNVKGGAFSSGNSILMQRERGKKRDKSKKEKVRAVGKIGGRKRAVPGRERAANEKGREGAS